MFSNFAGETLFYRYDARRSKDGDPAAWSNHYKSERIDPPYQRIAGVCFMMTVLIACATRIRDAAS
jgi:hypothetical protein